MFIIVCVSLVFLVVVIFLFYYQNTMKSYERLTGSMYCINYMYQMLDKVHQSNFKFSNVKIVTTCFYHNVNFIMNFYHTHSPQKQYYHHHYHHHRQSPKHVGTHMNQLRNPFRVCKL